MAYFSQERKAKLAPKVKAVLKKYGIKGSLAVRNHSTFVLNIKSGKIDFIANANKMLQKDLHAQAMGVRTVKDSIDVNVYHYDRHFDGRALKCLKEIMTVMFEGNWDKSDIMTDYFNVGWYVDVNIGQWNKPYVVTK